MSPSKRMGILELELDDWLDPSLPRMYVDEELAPTEPTFLDEFPANNEEFLATYVLPPYLPVCMLRDNFLLGYKRRIKGQGMHGRNVQISLKVLNQQEHIIVLTDSYLI
jgi:hypothetical protein